jgi:hypothetical protein
MCRIHNPVMLALCGIDEYEEYAAHGGLLGDYYLLRR